ncbi:tail fiber domain-containing protein [Bacillus toyonensis]|uniref:tail fiber domain-containing protein n=1 Tax=Bacillus toyonensis TaxID=155322 RepID=UPI000BEF570A|nr:tail fiber domain-containing protein [Bacillus toyonensis]PEM89479.1 hypothetical protein CN629_21725 [Bacillus toyonensis]
MASIQGDSNNPNVAAVFGDSTGGPGVWGNHKFDHPNASGVYGTSSHGVGVWGKGGRLAGLFEGNVEIIEGRVWANNIVRNPNASAVLGTSEYGVGVWGKSNKYVGVWGESIGSDDNGIYHPGVHGRSNFGEGIMGESRVGSGVHGKSTDAEGVYAESNRGIALLARTQNGELPALLIDHGGAGNLIIGRDSRNAEVFRVLNSGDVQVRGIALTSDKNDKENFLNVNTLEILDNLMHMSIQSWNYKTDPNNIRHIGPTAQDFQTAFGLNGDDDVHISGIDIQGVALAAIQGLNEKLKAENDELHTKLARLEERLSALESKS